MTEPLSIPEEKRMPDASLRNRALASVATTYSAGLFAGLASHYLYKPTYSSVLIAYVILSLALLGIALQKLGSIFPRASKHREPKNS